MSDILKEMLERNEKAFEEEKNPEKFRSMVDLEIQLRSVLALESIVETLRDLEEVLSVVR